MNSTELSSAFAVQQRLNRAGLLSVSVAALVWLLLSAPYAYPQASAPASDAAGDNPSSPLATTRVNEVALEIAVHDKHNKPILDVKPDDLLVADDGTPVKLNGFHLVRGHAANGHLVSFAFDTFSGSMAKQAQNVSEKVLKALPADGYSISVLNIGNRLRLVQGFTADRRLIEQAIDVTTASNAVTLDSTLSADVSITTEKAEAARAAYVAKAERDLMAVARTGVDSSGLNVDPSARAHAQVLLNALQDAQKIAQEQHSYRTLEGLLALVKAQERAPERKAIVYFTRNRELDSPGRQMIKNIAAAATRANVVFYMFDLDAMNDAHEYDMSNARGNAAPPFNPADRRIRHDVANAELPPAGTQGPPLTPPMQQEPGTPIAGPDYGSGPVWGVREDVEVMTDFHRFSGDYAMFEGKRSPMIELAHDSGGIYIDAQGNLKKPLQQMVEDLNTYYEATYAPPIKDYDGSYRTITVKPLRKNVKVQTKGGYFAVAAGADGTIRPFEAPLLRLLDSKQLPGDVHFKSTVLRFGEMPDGVTSELVVEVPIRELQTKDDAQANLFSAHAAIVARIRDSRGVQVERVGEDITRRGALASLHDDSTVSIGVERHFICAPGHYTLEVAVTDVFSGKTGVERSKFDVPDAAHAGTLSDVMLVRTLNPVAADDDDAADPLRYETSKVTPNILGELAQNSKGVSLFFVLHPDADAKEDPTLEVQVVRNGNPGRRMPLPLRMRSAGMPMPYLASFGSRALAPGDYKVITYLNQGGKTSVQQVAFRVDGASTELAHVDGAPKLGADGLETKPAAHMVLADLHTPGQLAIVPVSKPMQPLSADAATQVIERARQNALDYMQSLPNFMCVQVTNRSFDPSGTGRWKPRDSIAELLRYHDHAETRTTLEVDGRGSTTDRQGMQGSLSAGEFGGVLRAIFSPSAQGEFTWKETDALNSGTVQVFTYRVPLAHSSFAVAGSNGKEVLVGFHGQVFVDSATQSVRRLTLIADDLPKGFPTHSTRIDVDYDYVAIGDRDYLVPVSAEMRLTQGRHEAVLNTMEFRDYRHFGSTAKMVEFTPVERR